MRQAAYRNNKNSSRYDPAFSDKLQAHKLTMALLCFFRVLGPYKACGERAGACRGVQAPVSEFAVDDPSRDSLNQLPRYLCFALSADGGTPQSRRDGGSSGGGVAVHTPQGSGGWRSQIGCNSTCVYGFSATHALATHARWSACVCVWVSHSNLLSINATAAQLRHSQHAAVPAHATAPHCWLLLLLLLPEHRPH
jgi:hypothetical protein